MSLPLEGVVVLTLESFGAGPYGSMYLADLGADVIKIEDPHSGGDASRNVGPFFLGDGGDSHYFQTFNRNKKSVSLNLKTEQGQKTFQRLVGKADVVMNNLRGDLPKKLGLTYEKLKFYNESIVCAHLSAYGRNNSREGRPGYDYLMQAEAGFMSVTGEPDGPPTRMGLSIVDFIAGLTACVGLLSAVIGARRTGIGCDVDTCLFDVALHQTSYLATWYLNEGKAVGRMPRSAHPSLAPVQLFRTADGWIMVMCMKDKFWLKLLDVLQRPDLANHELFETVSDRIVNIQELTDCLDAEFEQKTTEHWVAMLSDSVPCAPVYDIKNALDSEFVKETDMIDSMPHPEHSAFKVLSNPIRINQQRSPAQYCATLGADTAEVLRKFGFSEEEIENTIQAVTGTALNET